ncbi:MAG: glycosyltransferase [Acidaminococcaceae bacterium]|nr:glycosyltransferase [Acidaminococcaceae bacterium]
MPLKLLIVGEGSQKTYLKKLAEDLGIAEDSVFTGKIVHSLVPVYDNMLSISVSVSNSESFGVAVIEASACEKPVVVSNVGGLPEAVEDGVTGLIVPPRNPEKTALAIEKLILDSSLRAEMGKAGRKRAFQLYNWHNNVQQMISIYKGALM